MVSQDTNSNTLTQSVEELVNARPDVDNSEVFETLTKLFAELRQKVESRLELKLDPSCADITPYHNLDGEVTGSVSNFSGPEVDWAVSSWMGTPQSSFTNLHLTVWLGPEIRVPHLWMAMGTIPKLFVYLDFGPRTELASDIDHLQKYYGPENDLYLDFYNDDRFTPFVSRSVEVRSFISPIGVCATAEPDADAIETASAAAHRMVDRWLGWLENPESVPVELQAAQAERDLYVRRQIAETDPANSLAERLLGKPLTERLVKSLWGGDRVLPRPGGPGMN